LEDLDEIVFPSIHFGQGKEERGLVSRAKGGEEGAEGGMGFLSRGQLGFAQDDSRRIDEA
jgi:hypothetical protein